MRSPSPILAASLFLLTLACNKSTSPPSPSSPPTAEPARAEAKALFETRCVLCHGARGGGDGPAAVALNPKPRNFQDKSWQTSITDPQIEAIIKGGGPAVGKSPSMPPNPDLVDKPAVLSALVAHIRSLGP